jgi:PAS domain S-box-containing protein
MIMFLKRWLTPPVFEDKQKNRAAYLLNMLLLVTIGLNLVNMLFIILPGVSFTGASLNIVFLFIQLGLYFLMRPHVRTASTLLIALYWLVVWYAAYDTDGLLNPVYIGQAAVIVMAGLLLGANAALLVAGVSVLGAGVLLYLSSQGILPGAIGQVTTAQAFINYVTSFGFIALLLYLALRNLNQMITRMTQEVGERKKVEQALSESEKRYRELFEVNPHPMWVYDIHTLEFLAVNDTAIRSYGYSRQEFMAMKLSDIRPADEMPDLLAAVRELHVGEPLRKVIWRHRKKEGTLIEAEVSAHVFHFEGREAVVVVAHDVTERLKTERALRESEERLRIALDHAGVTLSAQDRDLRYTWIYNPVVNRAEDILGKQDSDFVPAAEAYLLMQMKRQVLQTGEGTHSETRITTGNHVADYHLTIEPFRDDDGHVTGLICATLDITEQKRAQEDAHKAELLAVEVAQQKKLLQMKENFIRTVSHEFRTPLAIIMSSKEIMSHYIERLSPERRQEHLNRISTQVNYMVEMLEGILLLSKASAGVMDFEPKRLVLSKFCLEVIEDFRRQQKKHPINFITHFSDEIIMADPYLLRQVIVGLLSNAAKFSAENSPIDIELNRDVASAILKIRDYGIGIPQTDRDKLFEPFHRARNAQQIGGVGLGLAIVKTNVEAHGGSITYDTQEHQGTTFHVSIPLTAAHLVTL